MAQQILTIGHSTHSAQALLELLRARAVDVVADVRSKPYSRFNPDANREPLAAALKEQGIDYVFLGRELGARSDDPGCYENGQVQYRRLARTAPFKRGLRTLIDLARHRGVALLCAEKEPLACHRTILVARELVAVGVDVGHIHADGRTESQSDAMRRLLHELRMPETDLFRSRDELIAEAYATQEKRIAYMDNGMQVGAD